MLFQGSHSCYEFHGRFTDSFHGYLIFLLILLFALLAVNPYYLTLFLHFSLLSSHTAAASLHSLLFIPVLLAFSFRHPSCYVYLLICICRPSYFFFFHLSSTPGQSSYAHSSESSALLTRAWHVLGFQQIKCPPGSLHRNREGSGSALL